MSKARYVAADVPDGWVSFRLVHILFNKGTFHVLTGSSIHREDPKKHGLLLKYSGNIKHPMIGKQYRVYGKPFRDTHRDKDPWLFQFKKYKTVEESISRSVVAYLSEEARGIGPEKAASIAEIFTVEKLAATMISDPKKIVDISGIKLSHPDLESFIQFCKTRSEKQHTMRMRMYGAGLTANKIYQIELLLSKEFEDGESLAVIRKNFAALMNIPGFGFNTVRSIAVSCGVPNDDNGLIILALRHAFNTHLDYTGSTWIKHDQLISETAELVQCTSGKIANVLLELCKNRNFISEKHLDNPVELYRAVTKPKTERKNDE